MTYRELLQEALELMEVAIRSGDWKVDGACDPDMLFNSIRTRLAQPESEPVAVWELQEGGWNTIADRDWMESLPVGTKLYTAPPKKEWVGLTDEEIEQAYRSVYRNEADLVACNFADELESILKEKNT